MRRRRSFGCGARALAALLTFTGCGPEHMLEQGDDALRAGDSERALAIYQQVADTTRADPALRELHVDATWRAGETLAFYLKRDREAIEHFREAIARGQSAAERRRMLVELAGYLYETVRDFALAANYYEQLLEAAKQDRDAPEWYRRLCESYFRIGRFDALRRVSEDFSRAFPQHVLRFDVELLVAQSLIADNKYETAFASLTALLRTLGDVAKLPDAQRELYGRARFELGNVQARLGQIDLAQASYQEALRYHPNAHTVQLKLAALRARAASVDTDPTETAPRSHALSLKPVRVETAPASATPAAEPVTAD